MATDPRGLSGAVFQPTPLRDFIGDLQRQQQLTGQAMDRAAKMQESFFDEYGVEVPKDIPAPYLESYTNAANEYREESKRAFAMPDGAEKQKALRKLRTKKDQLLLGSQMAKERYATGVGYKNYLDEHGDKLMKDNPEKYEEIRNKAQNFITPQEQFKFYDDGALLFGDKTSAERFSENVIYGKPQDAPMYWGDELIESSEGGLGGYTTSVDNNVYVDKNKVYKNFDMRYKVGNPAAVKGVKSVIAREANIPIEEVTDEIMATELEENPQYVDQARQEYYDYVTSQTRTETKTKDDDEGGRLKPLNKTAGRYYEIGDIENSPNKFAVSIPPKSNVRIAAELPVPNEEGEETSSVFELKVKDVIRDRDGKTFYIRAYDRQGDEFIKIDTTEKRVQLEEALGVRDLDEWFEFKQEEAGIEPEADISGQPPVPQAPSAPQPAQETEGKKKTAADILKTPKG